MWLRLLATKHSPAHGVKQIVLVHVAEFKFGQIDIVCRQRLAWFHTVSQSGKAALKSTADVAH
jgi:hypothetical protein